MAKLALLIVLAIAAVAVAKPMGGGAIISKNIATSHIISPYMGMYGMYPGMIGMGYGMGMGGLGLHHGGLGMMGMKGLYGMGMGYGMMG